MIDGAERRARRVRLAIIVVVAACVVGGLAFVRYRGHSQKGNALTSVRSALRGVDLNRVFRDYQRLLVGPGTQSPFAALDADVPRIPDGHLESVGNVTPTSATWRYRLNGPSIRCIDVRITATARTAKLVSC